MYNRYVRDTDFEHRLTREDLVHAGVVGYLEAEQRLEADKSDNPSFFIYQNVSGRMMDLVRKQPMVKMPQQPYGRLKELKAAKKELEQCHDSVDTFKLAQHLGWEKNEVDRLLDSVPKVFSGDSRRDGDDAAGNFFDRLQGVKNNAPQLDATLKKEIAALVAHCLEQLKTARQRLILTTRYLEEMRLKDLAARFNCTEQAVHYQEGVALKQMRSCLENNGWQWDNDGVQY